MAIKVNGNEIPFVPNETVSQLLQRMKYIFPLLIVKIDGSLVKKKEYPDCVVRDNTTVDVIHLMSGG